jgi:hypothetical protein
VKVTVSFGRHVGRGRLSPEQQAVLERLERGEIAVEEAERLLGGSVHVLDVTIEAAAGEEAPAPKGADLSEEEIARRLVERIAQEVDAETRG